MKTDADIIFQERLDKCVAELIKRHNLAVENLTEQQLAQAIKDAIACGDFARFIAPQGQSVCYIPFAQFEMQKERVEFLERVLQQHGIDPYGTDPLSEDTE